MKSKFIKTVLACPIICVSLLLSSGMLCAATPGPEKAGAEPAGANKPSDPAKKGEKFIVRGREYCYECIDNSECLGCHPKISERKFPSLFMEPTPVTVATMTSQMSRPMPKPKGREFIQSRLPAIDVIRRKGQSIMQAPISSMIFNAKIAIKTSTR
jgi:hypothetical protein